MPYFTFRDREQSRPEIHGNWKAQLVSWLRKREKIPIKADTVGIALQSTASEFMAGHRMMEKFRPLVIYSIKKYFKILTSDSDPTKPPVGQTPKPNSIRPQSLVPSNQMAFDFHFESIFKNILTRSKESK